MRFRLKRCEQGTGLAEVLVALAIFAAVGVTFLAGLQTSGKAVIINQKNVTVEGMAKGAMEEIKGLPYLQAPVSYTADNITVDPDLIAQGYSLTANAEALPDPSYDDNIQKITVTVTYREVEVFKLEDYKVNR